MFAEHGPRLSMSILSAMASNCWSPVLPSASGTRMVYRHTKAPIPMGGRMLGTATELRFARSNGRRLTIQVLLLRRFERDRRNGLLQRFDVFAGDAEHVARKANVGLGHVQKDFNGASAFFGVTKMNQM